MKAEAAARMAIKGANGVVDTIVLIAVILLTAFAGYALWDSGQIYQAASKTEYALYKPAAENGGKTFQELQAVNPEVIAWITVYGTNIDYPVTQGPDNMKYINTNAEGQYSLSGAIFLDCENSRDFSDFNSILYGHHMEKKAMFGELGGFERENTFDTHPYGNLYYNGADHGIEFFALVYADAYDYELFTANVKGAERQAYLDDLLSKAVNKRELGVTTDDRIILLSTCSSESTNGRDILAGRITGRTYVDPFAAPKTSGGAARPGVDSRDGLMQQISAALLLLALILAALLALSIIAFRRRKRPRYAEATDTTGIPGTTKTMETMETIETTKTTEITETTEIIREEQRKDRRMWKR